MMRASCVLVALMATTGCEQVLGIKDPVSNDGVDASDGKGRDASVSACVDVPSFGSPTKYGVADATSLAVGDLNRDGLTDIAVAVAPFTIDGPSTRDVVVFLSTANGTLAPARPLSSQVLPGHSVRIADVDDDSYNDVITTVDNPPRIAIRRQDSAAPGTFLAAQFIQISSVKDVFPARVNGDNRADLIVSQVGVFLASTTDPGTFVAGQTFSSSVKSVRDVDADGFDDVVQASGAVAFNRGVGPFDFGAPQSIPNGLLGRFGRNGDRLDVLVLDTSMTMIRPVLDLHGQTAVRSYSLVAQGVVQVNGNRAVDLNGDGLDDIVQLEISVMTLPTPVAFQCPPPSALGSFFPSAGEATILAIGGLHAVADINADGKPDQLALTGSVNGSTTNFLEVALQQ